MNIKVENLYKTYKKELILNNINLDLESGKAYGFVGRNGSGKTMLLRAVTGLILPDSGRVLVNGDELNKDISFPTDMGLIIEKPTFIGHLSGFQNLKNLALIKNIINDEDIRDTMELVGLNSKSKKSIKKYSLGMKQRLGIAQALMENPKLLVLDEPFNGLDEEGVIEIRTILKDKVKAGTTLLLTSHNYDDIEYLCDKVFKLEKGVLDNEKGH